MTLLLSSHSSSSDASGPLLSIHSRRKAEPAAGPASTLTPPADPAEVDALDALLSMSMIITNISHDVPSPRAPPAPSSPAHGAVTANNNNSPRITSQVNQVHDRSTFSSPHSTHVLKSEPDSSPSRRLDPAANYEEVEEELGQRAGKSRASQRPQAAPFMNSASAIIDLLKTHQQLSTSTSSSSSSSTDSQTTTGVQQHIQTHLPGSIDSAPSSPLQSSSHIHQANPANSYERLSLSETAPSLPSTVGDSLESDHYDDAEYEGEEEDDDEEEGDDPDLFHLHPSLHALPGTKRKPQSEASKKGRSLYSCSHPGCGRSFDRRFNRDSHEMTHNPDRQRPFVCSNPECDQAFMRRHDLQRHEASKHKSVRLFSCQRCNKSFSRQDGLRRHVASKRLCFDKKSHFT